jgi:sigma-E factor negative regulatory protein RseC
MIVEKARVIAVEEGYAIVQTQRRSSCGACAAHDGCGVPLLGKLIPDRFGRLQVLNQSGAKVGDSVQIGMTESGLLKSALILYVLPLFCVVIAIALAVGIAGPNISDLTSILFCAAGFAVGLLIARMLGKGFADKIEYQTTIISIDNNCDSPATINFLP